MPEEEKFFRDTVRVTLHVLTQKGWEVLGWPGRDQPGGDNFFGLTPLTRPYGLLPGMVFQVQVWTIPERGPIVQSTFRSGLVEIECYNAVPPKRLPPDEHITRTVRTDPNGVATTTLTDAGWWALTAVRAGANRTHNGKSYPVVERTTLWVFVDEKGQ
jgi:uncharacterized GH25 family protein